MILFMNNLFDKDKNYFLFGLKNEREYEKFIINCFIKLFCLCMCFFENRKDGF